MTANLETNPEMTAAIHERLDAAERFCRWTAVPLLPYVRIFRDVIADESLTDEALTYIAHKLAEAPDPDASIPGDHHTTRKDSSMTTRDYEVPMFNAVEVVETLRYVPRDAIRDALRKEPQYKVYAVLGAAQMAQLEHVYEAARAVLLEGDEQ